MTWISVKDKKPGNTNNVLIYMTLLYPTYTIGFCHDDKFYYNSISNENITKWVTHWMPLPEPPNEHNG